MLCPQDWSIPARYGKTEDSRDASDRDSHSDSDGSASISGSAGSNGLGGNDGIMALLQSATRRAGSSGQDKVARQVIGRRGGESSYDGAESDLTVVEDDDEDDSGGSELFDDGMGIDV